MGLLASAFDNAIEKRGIPLSSDSVLGVFGVKPSRSGVDVTPDMALTLSAFWNGVQIIAGQTASIPLKAYRRLDPSGKQAGKERVLDDERAFLIHDEPNEETTAVVFRETLLQHVLTWGNGFAEIQRRRRSRRPAALWTLEPHEVDVDRDKQDRLIYRVTGNGSRVPIPARDILHVPGMGYDGVVGYPVVHMAREAIGMGLASEAFAASFYGRGAWPGLTIVHPRSLTPDSRKNIQDGVNATSGPGRTHGALVLGEGVKVERASMPLKDAQFLESRKFQVLEVARWLNIAPHKLKDNDNTPARAGLESEEIRHVTETLRPWAVRIEQEFNRKLFTRDERIRSGFFVEHVFDGLLRGDIKTRYEAYRIGRQWGWLSADDVLAMENMNPLPNGTGKIYLVPVNMDSAEAVAKRLAAGDPQPIRGVSQEKARGVSGDPNSNTDADAQRSMMKRARAAHRGLLIEAAGRVVRRQARQALRAAAGGPECLRAWLSTIGDAESATTARWLEPVVAAHMSTVSEGGGDPGAAAARLAKRHVDTLARELRGLMDDAAPQNLEDQVEAAAARWELEWPSRMADALLGRVDDEEAA